MITLTVKTDSGFEVTRSWELYRTTAPREYDYGWTVEVYDGDVERVVGLEVERAGFQLGRYASGLYRTERELGIDAGVAARLFERAVTPQGGAS